MFYDLQLERVCCIASRNGSPQIQALLPSADPTLLCSSLELDKDIYSSRQQYNQDPAIVSTCSELMPAILILPLDGQQPAAPNQPPEGGDGGGSIALVEEQKYSLALDLAISSIDELVKMCHSTEPLWIRSNDKYGSPVELLDFEEHERLFPCHYSKLCSAESGIKEASRDSAVIIMNSITLVDAFLDAVRMTLQLVTLFVQM